MSRPPSKIRKAIFQPYKIPGYFKRQFDHQFRAVGATRIVWPEPGRALLVDFGMYRPTGRDVLALTHASLVSPGTERAFFNAQPNARPEYPFYPGYWPDRLRRLPRHPQTIDPADRRGNASRRLTADRRFCATPGGLWPAESRRVKRAAN